MRDTVCVDFLRWALPRLHMRWRGFRRVRGQVCKRVDRRIRQLGLPDVAAYRCHLEVHPDEWRVLDGLCRVTISRFYRDRAVWDSLRHEVLPALGELARERGERELRCWSAGCGCGEEAYTLSMAWALCHAAHFPELALRVVADDLDDALLVRARAGLFSESALRELPAEWRARAFVRSGAGERIREGFGQQIDFRRRDVRTPLPRRDPPFHLVLCRNLVFTYFEESLQRQLVDGLAGCIAPGAALVVGIHEALPGGAPGFSPWNTVLGIYRRAEGA